MTSIVIHGHDVTIYKVCVFYNLKHGINQEAGMLEIFWLNKGTENARHGRHSLGVYRPCRTHIYTLLMFFAFWTPKKNRPKATYQNLLQNNEKR